MLHNFQDPGDADTGKGGERHHPKAGAGEEGAGQAPRHRQEGPHQLQAAAAKGFWNEYVSS
jgi:hypothetical protein